MTRAGVAVVQIGARLHYALPSVLARAGLLARLYTDLVAPTGLAKRLLERWPRLGKAPRISGWIGRTVPSYVRSHTRTVPVAAFVEAGLQSAGAYRAAKVLSVEKAIRRMALGDGFGGAAALYTVSNGDLELVLTASERGLLVVHEQISNPNASLLFEEEHRRFPGVEVLEPHEVTARGRERDHRQWSTASRVLCPSEFIRAELLASGVPGEKLRVVPYGIDQQWLSVDSTPVPGRVLFVGRAGLYKGVQYLAQATRILAARGVRCDVRVVGPMPETLLRHSAFRGPRYVGLIPRSEMRREFAQADVLAFPTLSESFGMVHLEALACGVPVVTTPNCGSLITDGREGFLVPIRNAEALADRIQLIVENRDLRDRLSIAARTLASRHTWEHYGEGVVSVMADLLRT